MRMTLMRKLLASLVLCSPFAAAAAETHPLAEGVGEIAALDARGGKRRAAE